MYNLRSSKKDTVQFPVQIQVDDEDLLNHKSSSFNDSTNMSDAFQESSDNELNCNALVNESDTEAHSSSDKSSKQASSSHGQQMNFADVSSDLKVQSHTNS